MEELTNILSSPVFWIINFFLAIIISVIGNNLTTIVNKFFGFLFENIRERSEKSKLEKEKKIQILVMNPHTRTEWKNKNDLKYIKFLLQSIIVMIVLITALFLSFLASLISELSISGIMSPSGLKSFSLFLWIGGVVLSVNTFKILLGFVRDFFISIEVDNRLKGKNSKEVSSYQEG